MRCVCVLWAGGGWGRGGYDRLGGMKVMRKGSLVNWQREPEHRHFLRSAMSAGPDSNPFKGLLVLTEC